MARLAPPAQMSLLDWQPVQPVVRFADEQVRAASIEERLSRAIAASLRDSPHSREEIASRMSSYAGREVSVNMLNAYASQARGDQVINVVRLMALIHATQDRRLLELFAEMFGWTVIERRFLKLLDLAAIRDKEEELQRQRKALTAAAKSEGILG